MQKHALTRFSSGEGVDFCTWPAYWRHRYITKTLLVVKLTIILMTATFLQAYSTGLSQNVTYSGVNMPLEKVFQEIKEQTGFVFFYDKAAIKNAKLVTIKAENQLLQNFLDDILKDQLLRYRIESKNIIISKKMVGFDLGSWLGEKVPPSRALFAALMGSRCRE